MWTKLVNEKEQEEEQMNPNNNREDNYMTQDNNTNKAVKSRRYMNESMERIVDSKRMLQVKDSEWHQLIWLIAVCHEQVDVNWQGLLWTCGMNKNEILMQ